MFSNRSFPMLVILLTACLAACGHSEDKTRNSDAIAVVDLRVMSFNIEWGGTHISFENVVEAIRRANADIVGIQEAEGNLQRLAACSAGTMTCAIT